MTPLLHSVHITLTDLQQNVPVFAAIFPPTLCLLPVPLDTLLAAHASSRLYLAAYTKNHIIN
jgi:hypothetical protein